MGIERGLQCECRGLLSERLMSEQYLKEVEE